MAGDDRAMFREREDEPYRERRPQQDTQPSEREDRSDASAPWLLGMQQSAGNQAVARMLAAAKARTGRSGTLQRDPVTGTTRESASGGHHPDFGFQFPGRGGQAGRRPRRVGETHSPKGGARARRDPQPAGHREADHRVGRVGAARVRVQRRSGRDIAAAAAWDGKPTSAPRRPSPTTCTMTSHSPRRARSS